MVVEDSDEDFATVVEACTSANLGCVIRRAHSGDECLAMLRAEAARHAFVLLDLNTPGMDGRDAVAEIRADDRLASLPVIVLSTSDNPRDVDGCYARGANAYHVKPMMYVEHLRLVRELLHYWLDAVVLPIPDLKP
jgi:two-component system response regulator